MHEFLKICNTLVNKSEKSSPCNEEALNSHPHRATLTQHKPRLVFGCVCARTVACVCVRPRRCVFVRQRVACEELDMSFRGIRHLKREEVQETQLVVKNQATSAAACLYSTLFDSIFYSILIPLDNKTPLEHLLT